LTWRNVRLATTVSLAVLTIWATQLLVRDTYDGGYQAGATTKAVAIVIVAFTAGCQQLLELTQRFYVDRRDRVREAAASTNSVTLAAIVHSLQSRGYTVDPTRIGLTTFSVRRRRIGLRFRKVQVPVARVKLAVPDAARSLLFTRDKGIIGECWQRRVEVARDFTCAYHELDPENPEHAERWAALDDQYRTGLTWEDYGFVAGTEVVIVAPLLERDNYVGCLALTAPASTAHALLDRHDPARVYLRGAVRGQAKLIATGT
jgi:hypothetical protein